MALTSSISTTELSDILMRTVLSRTMRPSNCILCSALTSGATSTGPMSRAPASCEKVGSRVEKSAVKVARSSVICGPLPVMSMAII